MGKTRVDGKAQRRRTRMSTELPKITIDQVVAWTDDASFERGQAYYQQGRISAPQRQGVWLPSQVEEIGEDWGRHLNATAVTYAATNTAT